MRSAVRIRSSALFLACKIDKNEKPQREHRGLCQQYVSSRLKLKTLSIPSAACSEEVTELGELPTGVLIGTVEVVGCTGESGAYEWHPADPERLSDPIEPERTRSRHGPIRSLVKEPLPSPPHLNNFMRF
jgi:hypothetical protein